MAIENQQVIINDVIEVKTACIRMKLKQIQLMTMKNTPSLSSKQGAGKSHKLICSSYNRFWKFPMSTIWGAYQLARLAEF